MMELFSVDNLLTLLMLFMLQAVLGFDNLLYVAIESKRAPEKYQKRVRQLGIGLAIVLRIILLFVVIQAIELFQSVLFEVNIRGLFEGAFSGHSLIVLFGGGFIIWTAIKEIMHMLAVEHIDQVDAGGQKSVFSVVASIIFMNLVFSFDSILSAIALTDVFIVMATAIIISGILMIVMADGVAEFLKENRMYEVLGLFILFIVGILLVSEGGHLAHVKLMDFPVEAMSKSTFYFVIMMLVLIVVAQSRYRKKLMTQHNHEINDPKVTTQSS
ncbi:MAG: TerC family protein [Pseudomonadota bacterium]